MVNNSAKIGTMLSFTDKDDFYFLQILKRRKDNPDLSRDMIVINNYYIESLEHYIKLVPQIIKICDVENARAYIRLNKRNYKHLSYHMLKRVVEVVSTGSYKSLKGSFDSVTGEYHADKNKTWVVDIDWVDFDITKTLVVPKENGDLGIMSGDSRIAELFSTVQGLQLEAKREPMMVILPTKNGIHIITRPFNLQIFKTKFPKVDVHKDNPSILYCP
jgi:hypothetical protein